MATVLGLLASSTVWYLTDTDRNGVRDQIVAAMSSPTPLTLPLANNGLLVLKANELTHFCLFDVEVPDPAGWAPFRPGVSSAAPERVIM